MMRSRLFAKVTIEALEGRFLLDGTFDVSGVQPAALDQPRVHVLLRRSPGGDPLIADDGFGDTTFDIQAFLDTGTSGTLLSQETSSGLGVQNEQVGGQDVFYADTGVAGDEGFNVSEPLYGSIAPFSPAVDGTDAAQFNTDVGPFRYEVNPVPVADPDLEDPLDILGMPAIQGKVMVMDPKPVDQIDYMNTYLYPPGTKFNSTTADTNPGIPDTTYHIKLSYSDFSRFTALDPPDAAGPTLFPNPMIGPDPVAQLDGAPPDNTPPVTIGQGGFTTTGSFLFDSGSAASFISTSMADRVHVHYADGTYNTDNPLLVDDAGNPIPNQFSLPLGGIGGTINAAGFYLDSMTLQTQEGVPVRFLGAPVLVVDVMVQDPNTGQQLTLDGDFGMNNLVASVSVTPTSTGTDFGASRAGPWDWVTFDQSTGLLGLEPSTGAGGGGGGSEIVDRQVFYNHSTFSQSAQGNDGAIASDKTALLPGQTATFNNYTSYSNGINGIMIDIFGDPDPALISTNDFQFAVGNDSNPGNWTPLTVAPVITARPGAEDFGLVDRLELTWTDQTISNEWLQVKMLANGTTGLSLPDVFYFGNAPGETGNSLADAGVNVFDVLATRHSMTVSADVTNPYDFNRDGAVNGQDVLFARSHQTDNDSVLNLINAPLGVGPGVSNAPVSAQTRSIRNFGGIHMSLPVFGTANLSRIEVKSSTPALLSTPTRTAVAPPARGASAAQQPAAKLLATATLPPASKNHADLFSRAAVLPLRSKRHAHSSAPRHPSHASVVTTSTKKKTPFADIKIKHRHAVELL